MRYRLLMLFMLLMGLLLSACAAPRAIGPTTEPGASGPAGDSRELILAAPRDLTPGENDPYYAHPMLGVWESLITTDEDWVSQPELATAWELSEDGLTWTFHLREDVVFSDGSPFNADVVIANVERNLRISPRSSPFYSFDKDVAYGDLDRVEKVDDYTVQFIHHMPDIFFVDKLATFYSAMFAPASFDENGDFAGFPIGSGPFRIVEREAGQYFVLEPNPLYRGDPPRASRIRVRTIPDPNTRASALRAGEIHSVLDLGVLPPPIAEDLVQTGDFQLSQSPIQITHYLYTNSSRFPWNDLRMRQALSKVIDRATIADQIWMGYALPAHNLLNRVIKQWHDPSIELPFDPEEAATLAQEVLGEERIEARLIFSSGLADRGHPYKLTAEYLQAQLRPLGIDLEIQMLDGNAYNEATSTGNYDLALSTHGVANSEPAHIFHRIVACDGLTNQRMSLDYCNPEAETLLQALAGARDPVRQLALVYELQAIAARDLPAIPLFYDMGSVVYANEVEGYRIKTNYWITLDTAHLK